MSYEGGGWFTFTFPGADQTTNSRVEFASYITSQHNQYDSAQTYTPTTQIIFQNVFADHPDLNEVWISVPDLSEDPTYSFIPPASKTIFFYKPWDLGGACIEIDNLTTVKMRGINGSCTWFKYNYYGTLDKLHVRFFNPIDSSFYSFAGLGDSSFMNLGDKFTSGDSIWVFPNPLPSGAPAIQATSPGIEGECGTIVLAAKLRDKSEDHPDFQSESCGIQLRLGQVEKHLSSDGKPVRTDTSCISDRFSDWFVAESLGGGYTNEHCYNLTLNKNSDGLYEYDTNAFYPLDDFQYLDDAGTVPNPNYVLQNGHDYYFTMELGCEFTYTKGQTFYFRGDDDVWVFIDSQLVVDIGGIHNATEGSVDLDTLGLTEGNTYNFKLFFAERWCCGSNFKMVTSIDLRTSKRMFYEIHPLSDVITQYDMYEKITGSNLSCDFSNEPADTIRAVVEFYLDGPSFTSSRKLSSGVSYGGITISPDYGSVVLDESSFEGLQPGDYVISFYSSSDLSQGGTIPFTVPEVRKPSRVTNPVSHAAYYADNGFGQVSRAEIYFEQERVTPPDSILFSWPSILKTKTAYSNQIVADSANKKHYTINFTEPFEKEITTFNGTKRLGISYSYDTTFAIPLEVVKFDLDDSVGPLISNAILAESSTGIDTILLTFSESVDEQSIVGTSLLLVKPDTTITITVSSATPWADTLKITIADPGGTAPARGDSIRILSSGPLTDRYSNHAHLLNRAVPLIIRERAANMEYAYYRDVNADGIVDEAVLDFDKRVFIPGMTAMFYWGAAQTDTLPDNHVRYGTDSTQIIVNLVNEFPTMKTVTSGKMGVLLHYANFPNVPITGDVEDSVAPVLLSATYHPALINVDITDTVPDTLVVVFSEMIANAEKNHPFQFKKMSGSEYAMTLDYLRQSGTQYTFLVREITPVTEYPSQNDSVWINPQDSVTDMVSNIQTNSSNRHVLLSVNKISLTFQFKWGPNPFYPISNKNFTVHVNPSVKTKEQLNLAATFRIYDAVGNIVHDMSTESGQSQSASLHFVWNGRNRSGRFVGTGTYLGIVRVIDNVSGSTGTARIRIGLKR